PYSQGIVTGGRIYVAGQGPVNPETGVMPEGIAEQTRRTLMNVKAILEEGGASMEHVVKATVHLTDLENFQGFNEVYKEFFSEPYPVRTTVQSVLIGDMLVEVDVIAEFD
ncbi:MAG: RidA family protein, partial [Synergistaceae bacterium]|nr:RidA family protein [Synergistaceae bacterium]